MSTKKTDRQYLYELLTSGEVFGLRDLQDKFKDVTYQELEQEVEHVLKSAKHENKKLKVTPAECARCQFVFEDRKRITTPSRCPKCKSERILDPLFRIA